MDNNNLKQISNLIDNLSQELTPQQFIDYMYPLIHQELDMESSCIYLQDFKTPNKTYFMKKAINYSNPLPKINYSDQLNTLATLHGRILTKDFIKYFPKTVESTYNPSFVLPMIIEDHLIGFIIFKNATGETVEYSSFLKVIEKATNLSSNKIIYKTKLKKVSETLNQEIYNLSLTNHLAKLIIAETDIEKLYTFCVDTIREITASKVTALAVYDPISNSIPIKHMRDIITQKKLYLDFELKNYDIKNIKHVYSIKKDKDALEEIFANYNDFNKIDAEYIILILNDKIEGFITISKAVNNKKYDENILKQVKNIISFIYIAITNASNFVKIQRNNKKIRQQLNTLKNLNYAIKSITSCEDISSIIDTVMTTLNLQFDVQGGAFLLNTGDSLEVKKSFGIDKPEFNYDNFTSYFYHDFSQKNLKNYLTNHTEEDNCTIISPIKIEKLLEDEILGYIFISKVQGTLQEFQLTAFKSIANTIAPIIQSYRKVTHIKENYIMNPKKEFMDNLKEYIYEKQHFELDFYINYTQVKSNPFEQTPVDFFDTLDEYWKIENYVFSLSYNPDEQFSHHLQIDTLEEFYKHFK